MDKILPFNLDWYCFGYGEYAMLELIKNTPENSVTPDKMFIAGFEIPFPAPELVSSDHPDYNKDLPLFSKTANSDVLYAAGWYAINFEKGWKHGYCPKKK